MSIEGLVKIDAGNDVRPIALHADQPALPREIDRAHDVTGIGSRR